MGVPETLRYHCEASVTERKVTRLPEEPPIPLISSVVMVLPAVTWRVAPGEAERESQLKLSSI